MGLTLGRMNWGEAAFGVAPAVWTYLEILGKPNTSGLKRPYHADERLRQTLTRTPGVIGAQSESSIDLELPLRGINAAAPAAGPLTATVIPHIRLLSHAMGDGYLFDGGAGTAFSTCTAIDVTKMILTLVDETKYLTGVAIGLWTNDGTTNRFETGVIQDKDAVTHKLTLRAPLANATPGKVGGGSITVYAGYTLYLSAKAWGIANCIGLQILGDLAADMFSIQSARPAACSLELNPKEFGKLKATLGVAEWTMPGAGGNPAYVAPATPVRQQIMGGVCRVYMSAARTELDTNTMSLDLGLKTDQPKNQNYAQGVGDIILLDRDPILKMNPTYLNQNLRAGFAAGTPADVLVQFGSDAGRVFGVNIPVARLNDETSHGDVNDRKIQELAWQAQHYEADITAGGKGSAAANSDMCVFFL